MGSDQPGCARDRPQRSILRHVQQMLAARGYFQCRRATDVWKYGSWWPNGAERLRRKRSRAFRPGMYALLNSRWPIRRNGPIYIEFWSWESTGRARADRGERRSKFNIFLNELSAFPTPGAAPLRTRKRIVCPKGGFRVNLSEWSCLRSWRKSCFACMVLVLGLPRVSFYLGQLGAFCPMQA